MLEKHVQNADILLFRASPFPSIGWWIAKLSFGRYSHVGIAKRELGELYCIEFREFRRSRKFKVSDYVKKGAVIDVFRVSPMVKVVSYNNIKEEAEEKSYHFDQNRVNKILERAEYMIGRKYNWASIKNIWFTYMPFVRWFTNSQVKDNNGTTYVCSTFISYLLRKYYIDPCPYLPDNYTKPSDLARSNLLNFMFTLD